MDGQTSRFGRGLVRVAAVVALGTVGLVAAMPDGDKGSASPGFGKVTVRTDHNVDGAGQNVDSIAFWQARRPDRSLMFVTSKDEALVEVWRYPFDATSAKAPLTHSCLEHAADSATNGVVVDQRTERLYVASNHSPNVCVFSLPGLTHQRTITSGADYGLEPNLALLHIPDRPTRLYVSDDDVVYVHDAATGRRLTEFEPATAVETMWGDSRAQVLYIPDETGASGVHAYDPDGNPYTRRGSSVLGNGEIFDGDAEGILGYTCSASGGRDNGRGLIVVSDQVDSSSGGNDYEVFDRRTWVHVATLRLRLPQGSGYVAHTDGIASTQQASQQYPRGFFSALHDDTSVAGVGWRRLLEAISAHLDQPFACSRRNR